MSLSPDRNQDNNYKSFDLASASHNPDGIARFLMGMLRWFYANSDNFGKLSNEMARYKWSKGADSGLAIDLDLNVEVKDGEKMPAIKIKFGKTEYEQVALGHRARGIGYAIGDVTVTLAATGFEIQHYAATKADAYQLAILSLQFLRGMHKRLTSPGYGNCGVLLHKFLVHRIGDIEPIESKEAKPFYRVSLLLQCAYESAAVEFEESLPLKTLTATELLPYCEVDGSSIQLA